MKTKEIGKIGEDVACMFLVKRGYSVVWRNYYRKWGEIDIVAQRDSMLYFVEVKAVTYRNVTHETNKGEYRPEDNIHPWKLKKLSRIIDTYLKNTDNPEQEWKVLGVTVRLNMNTRRASVSIIDDVIV